MGRPAPAGDPTAVVLAKTEPRPTGCMLTSLRWVCSPSLATLTEEEYGFDQAFTDSWRRRMARIRGSAVIVAPRLLNAYAQFGGHTSAWASSVATSDPQDLARSAFDADPRTAWVARASDPSPWLRIRWARRVTVRRVTIQRPPGASAALQVLISGSRGRSCSPMS